MPFTAYGSLTAPFTIARAMVASSAYFKEWLTADWAGFDGTTADALTRVHFGEVSAANHVLRPYCLISPAPKISDKIIAVGEDSEGNVNGTFLLEFVRDVPASCIDTDGKVIYDDAYTEFSGYYSSGAHGVAPIMEDLFKGTIDAALSLNPLIINEWEIIDGPGLAQDEEMVDGTPYMGCVILVSFGVNG